MTTTQNQLSQMTATYQSNALDISYNGWANYETWNVSLWMQNNQFLYNTAVACVEYVSDDETPYEKFIRNMHNVDKFTTADGVAWDDELVNHDEINEMMFDNHNEENV